MTYDVQPIPLDQIADGPKVRAERIDLDHVALLELAEHLPPITVRRIGINRFQGITGAHRRVVAKRKGQTTISAQVIECTDDEALERAIADNLEHGKPVSRAERHVVALRMINGTDWSNVRIAQACGLDDKTVSSMRPTSETPKLDTLKTTGHDGKARPATQAAAETNREKVRHLAVANPDASAREIAREVGVSPTTAATVIAETKADPPKLEVVAPAETNKVSVAEVVTTAPMPGRWSRAVGFDRSNAARDLARFLDRRLMRDDEDVAVLADGCPAAQRDAVAMVARDAARQWELLADHLDNPNQVKGVR